jgi:ectoine hydroxylase-related dioxygenase (phytanoyl-CoA dioxygenase family)
MSDAGLFFSRQAPGSEQALRSAVYAGEVFQLAATAATQALVIDARAALAAALADCGPDPRVAARALPGEEFFRRMGALRRLFYTDPRFHDHLRAVVAAAGFCVKDVAFDPLRLRVVDHLGHENPSAAAVYYPHRDTWYGHPSALIVGWIALDDLLPEETFWFFPQNFAAPAPNDSEIFDYDAWVRDGWSLKIGWQDPEAGRRARYPRFTGGARPAPAVGFGCAAGELLLFSGAHLHETRSHALGRTRFSLDFRLVHLGDAAAGRGAPNVDGRARGSALADYVRGAVG